MGTATVRVLVVDDEKVIRDFLKRLLSLSNIEVVSVEDGFQAIEEAKKGAFDIVFLDVRMPKKDGLETLRELKKVIPQSKFVMMTGYAVDDLLQLAQQEGAGLSIRKPFDLSQIDGILKDFTRIGKAAALSILVIDDETVVLNFFSRLLKDNRYDLTAVSTGQDALAALAKKRFDLVFLDVVLKDVPALDLYDKIHAQHPATQIVLITGFPEQAEKLADQAQIKGCLYKPFEIDKIFKEIDAIRAAKGV